MTKQERIHANAKHRDLIDNCKTIVKLLKRVDTGEFKKDPNILKYIIKKLEDAIPPEN